MCCEVQQAVIYECLSFDDAWKEVLEDWFFKKVGCDLSDLPWAVVVPNDASVQFIKERLLKRDIPLLGVEFYTPGTLRHYLSKVNHCLQTVELRENLHLLMKVVARGLEGNAIAQAAAVEPEQFVRLADLLEAAGWQASVLKNDHVRELIKKYQEAREQYGMITAQSMANGLWELSKNPELAFSNLLVFGFSSKHWTHYKLLLTAVRSSQKAILCFLTQDNGRLIDQAWLGSWEQELGVSKRISGGLDSKLFDYLSYYFDEANMREEVILRGRLPEIYIAKDILREAEVIVARIAEALARGEVSRLGVVFPNQTSPLGREVARLLEEEEIAHYNHLGYVGERSRGQQLFEGWVAWQKSRRLGAFLVFLDELVNQGKLGIKPLQAFEKNSCKALQTLLTDDLELIFTYFKVNYQYDNSVLELLKQWSLLPEETTFQIYVELARKAMQSIGWPEDLELIEQRAGLLLVDLEKPISKGDFLLWLSGVTKPLGRISKYWGQHHYAFVHLITEEEGLMQSWSHLILAGVNQGEWPSEKPEVIFLEDRQIADLNFVSLKQGNQGDGHLAVKDGFSLLVSSADHYGISQRNFSILLGMPSKQLILTAHMKDLKKSKIALMSEFLERVYWMSAGVLLDASAIRGILHDTENWISQYRLREHKDVKELVHAYQKRRNIEEPFDEYSFSFKGSNKVALNVSCKAWEEILTSPQGAWLKHILGVEKNEVCLGKSLYALARGTWVHAWIRLEGEGKQLDAQAWSESIKEHAQKVYGVVQKTFDASNWPLPDIWKGCWNESLRIALSLREVLSEGLSNSYLFSEYSIADNREKAQLPNLRPVAIPLKGRIDLLAYPLPHMECKDYGLWILDFKTGVSGSLTENKVANGTGVQLVLYALKFYLEGFNNIEMSIVQPGVSLSQQVNLKSLLDNCSIFDAINDIYNSGKLGIRTSMDGVYGGRSGFPLATIKIGDDILKKKWELTHTNLSFKE